MSDPSDMNDIKALAAQLAAIRAQVKTHGGFVGDRELHQCPACGLMEDVLYGGKLVTCGATSGDQPPADLRRIFIRQLQIFGSTLGNLQEFKDLLVFCEQHHIRPVIDRVFAMDQVHEALDVMSRAEQFGKIALALDASRNT